MPGVSVKKGNQEGGKEIELISYIVKPTSTAFWDQSIDGKDHFVIVRLEPANWLARVIGRFLKMRVTVDILSVFDGTISKVMIFNRVLSREEIQELYQRSKEK